VSKLSKAYKKNSNILPAVMTGGLSLLGNIGAKPGPSNPYAPPDPNKLFDTSKIDFLKDPTRLNYMKDASGFDFLRNPTKPNPLADNSDLSFLRNPTKTFANSYTAPDRSRSDSMFNDLLSGIDAPDSVDAVRGDLDKEQLSNTLRDIDRDTAQSVGSAKMDYQDRGLSGPGMMSDIEAIGLAQARGKGDETKANARIAQSNAELDRLKAKEEARNSALGARYQTGAAQDANDAQIKAQGTLADLSGQQARDTSYAGFANQRKTALADDASKRDLAYADILRGKDSDYSTATNNAQSLFAQLLNARDLGAFNQSASLYDAGENRKVAGTKPSYLDNLLRNINVSVPLPIPA
jgi:hypothetical protein